MAPTDQPEQIPIGSLSAEVPSQAFSCLEFAGERERCFFRGRKPPVPATPLCLSAQEPVNFRRPRAGSKGHFLQGLCLRVAKMGVRLEKEGAVRGFSVWGWSQGEFVFRGAT